VDLQLYPAAPLVQRAGRPRHFRTQRDGQWLKAQARAIRRSHLPSAMSRTDPYPRRDITFKRRPGARRVLRFFLGLFLRLVPIQRAVVAIIFTGVGEPERIGRVAVQTLFLRPSGVVGPGLARPRIQQEEQGARHSSQQDHPSAVHSTSFLPGVTSGWPRRSRKNTCIISRQSASPTPETISNR